MDSDPDKKWLRKRNNISQNVCVQETKTPTVWYWFKTSEEQSPKELCKSLYPILPFRESKINLHAIHITKNNNNKITPANQLSINLRKPTFWWNLTLQRNQQIVWLSTLTFADICGPSLLEMEGEIPERRKVVSVSKNGCCVCSYSVCVYTVCAPCNRQQPRCEHTYLITCLDQSERSAHEYLI